MFCRLYPGKHGSVGSNSSSQRTSTWWVRRLWTCWTSCCATTTSRGWRQLRPCSTHTSVSTTCPLPACHKHCEHGKLTAMRTNLINCVKCSMNSESKKLNCVFLLLQPVYYRLLCNQWPIYTPNNNIRRQIHAVAWRAALKKFNILLAPQEGLRALKPVLLVTKQAVVKWWILSFERHKPSQNDLFHYQNLNHSVDNIWKE